MNKGFWSLRVKDYLIFSVMTFGQIMSGYSLAIHGVTWRYILYACLIAIPAGVYIFNRLDILHYEKEKD